MKILHINKKVSLVSISIIIFSIFIISYSAFAKNDMWFIHLKSFSDVSKAYELSQHFENKGYNAYIKKINIYSTSLYGVYVGIFSSKSKAEKIALKLTNQKLISHYSLKKNVTNIVKYKRIKLFPNLKQKKIKDFKEKEQNKKKTFKKYKPEYKPGQKIDLKNNL